MIVILDFLCSCVDAHVFQISLILHKHKGSSTIRGNSCARHGVRVSAGEINMVSWFWLGVRIIGWLEWGVSMLHERFLDLQKYKSPDTLLASITS